MKRLILVGGGHAHLFALKAIANAKPLNWEVLFINPNPWQYYSGMLPGWMAGHYQLEECRIAVRVLAESAGIGFIEDTVTNVDANQQCVYLSDGTQKHYDLLSLNIGSETNCQKLIHLKDRLLPIKSLSHFIPAWNILVNKVNNQLPFHLIIIGGGAAGVEIALASHTRLTRINANVRVTLVTGEHGLLANHNAGVCKRITRQLRLAGIQLSLQSAYGTEHGITLSDGTQILADFVIAASDAHAPAWLPQTHLMLNSDKFIAVNSYHQSTSHQNVFAAGDICSRNDVQLDRSGVHAVRTGPILARNLLSQMAGESLTEFFPQKRSLFLLACGAKYAVVSWGSWSAEGHLAWRWKNWLDKSFIKHFFISK